MKIRGYKVAFGWLWLWPSKGDHWYQFEPFSLYFEAGSYKGRYVEVKLVALNVGFWCELYQTETREEFAAEMKGYLKDEGIDIGEVDSN